ncbi:MAG: Ig-like domain-containing protein [Salinivirgaceae bacterium]|nr:Ig-like domain-containing protein [Salinivirgaceae bacterium]
MKTKHLLKRTCLSLALLIGAGTAWGAVGTKTEGFETATAGSAYQGTVTVTTDKSDCGIGWEIYYGCVSTSSKISGINSAAIRLYKSDKDNDYGYIKTTTAIDGLSKVTFNAKSATSGDAKIKVHILYSANNTVWDTIKSDTTFASSSKSYSFNIPNGGKYFQIAISKNSIKPSKNIQLTIDDVVFTYTYTDETDPELSIASEPLAIKGKSIDFSVTATEDCKVYYKAVAHETEVPSADDVIATNTYTQCAENEATTVTVSGLTKATTYNIYFVAVDDAGNYKEVPYSKTNVTTLSTWSEVTTVSSNKLYSGESATIEWTTEDIAADANVKIELYNGTEWSTLVASTANDGSENITIDANTAYGTKYKLRVSLVSDETISAESEEFSIIPSITINELLTNIGSNGESNYKSKVVRVKGLVTGIKNNSYRNIILQNGNSAIYVQYCDKYNDTHVSIGDSVYVEGKVLYYNNGKFLAIGTNSSHAQVTIINHDNNLPEPTIVSLADVHSTAFLGKIVKLQGVTYNGTKKYLQNSTDTIGFYSNMCQNNVTLLSNRKYDIIGAIGYYSDYQIWPRSFDTAAVSYTGKDRTYTIDDIYLYSNDTTLSALTIGGKSVNMDFQKKADTVFFVNFNNCKGIAATANHAKARILTVKVNGNAVATADLATKTLKENDIVSITVEAEDGTVGTRDIRILKDLRSFSFAELQNSTFNTNNTISLSWTQQKVDNFDLYFTAGEISVKLNDNVLTSTNTTLNYTVSNGIYGTGYIKAVATADNEALDSLAVTINDTQAPAALKLAPANAATNVATNVNLIISFDEAVKVAEEAKMKANTVEAKIVVINDTAIKAYFEKLDYATEYTVTLPAGSVTDAAGNTPTLNWKFTTRPQPVPELFFSEYCSGSGQNKYYEIYNPKDEDVDLSEYLIMIEKDGKGKWEKGLLNLQGIILSENVYIVAIKDNRTDSLIKANADILTSNTTSFSGNDALGLFKITNEDTVLIDMFGNYLEDPGTAWTVAGIANATKYHTLIRKDGIICGSTDWSEQAGTDSLDSQWIVKECDDFSSIRQHGVGRYAKIMSFNIEAADNATIDNQNKTISIEAVYGTDVTAIAPKMTFSRGATATIGGAEIPATIDFSNPVVITVTSEDGLTTTEWTITITVAALPSTAAEIRTFSFANVKPLSVNIDTAAASVNALFDYGIDLTALTPVFTISAAASVSETTLKIDSLQQYTSVKPIDFSSPWTVKVQAQDPKVSKLWTISASTLQPESLTIYQIQYTDKDASAYVGKFVATIGVITSINGKEIYIQDSASAWNGILVYDAKEVVKDAKVGDKVKVIGTVTEYSTITEIELANIEVMSSGNSVEPIVMTIEDSELEAYEAVLVTFKNVTCKRIDQKNDYNNYIIEDATDTLTVYNKYRLDIQMIVDSIYDVTGIMHYYPAGKVYEIIPRTPADIVKIEKEYNGGNENGGNNNPNAISNAVANISIYAYNRTVVVENANADIAIFDVNGRMVAKRTANNSRIEMQLPKNGLYIVKVGSTSQKVILK